MPLEVAALDAVIHLAARRTSSRDASMRVAMSASFSGSPVLADRLAEGLAAGRSEWRPRTPPGRRPRHDGNVYAAHLEPAQHVPKALALDATIRLAAGTR